jgi:hypothetical protein
MRALPELAASARHGLRRCFIAGQESDDAHRTAIGATVEPVPPWIFNGWMMKANS